VDILDFRITKNEKYVPSIMYILGSVITGRDRRGRDCMVVGFTTYAISAYHH